MEYLRWILLAAGIFFILFIYLLGRNRRRQNEYDDVELQGDVPEFSAQDWDDLDEGVGKVRIIARDSPDEYSDEIVGEPAGAETESTDVAGDEQPVAEEGHETATHDERNTGHEHKEPGRKPSDIIVLYIIARPEQKFSGDRINSAAQANGLVFGDMNIFHRLDEYEQPVFSLANMVEPGSFDPETLHDLHTPGLTMFMQVSEVVEPGAAFDDMLRCAYHIAELLDGQLCNRRRQTLTQADAEEYRELVTGVDA